LTDPSTTIIQLDGVTFALREPHDFAWLQPIGEVFEVFDQQDSGNISFGVRSRDGKSKRFIKYAGAKTLNFNGQPDEAVSNLRQAVQVYEELAHPNLIALLDHFPVAGGYAAIYEWFAGETLHPHWSYPPPAKYNDPRSPFHHYKKLPIPDRLTSLDAIFTFHLHVAERGYVAVDFYDGSILYDFATNTTRICDIDLYQRRPFINTMGRLWGSSRFMSPEEFELGAPIDEVTNVFNMGAMTFCLLGGERDRSLAKWEAGEQLYEVAAKATAPDRSSRYSSLTEFYEAWARALKA
jgi:serine/threonine-protein kinase